MRINNLFRRQLGNRGATAVETALALPVFLLLVLGGVDLGLWLLHTARLLDAGDRALRELKAGPSLVVLTPGEQVFCSAAPMPGCTGRTVASPDRLLLALEAARASLPTLAPASLIVQYKAAETVGAAGRIALCVSLTDVQHDFIFIHTLPGLGQAVLLRSKSQCDYLPFAAYRTSISR